MTTKEHIQRFIVNNLGINLNSVKDIFIIRQQDGQIKEICIKFIPANQCQKIVEEWQKNNPSRRQIDCYRATGISRPTIAKYWKSRRVNNG